MKFKYRIRHKIASWGFRHVFYLFGINLILWVLVSFITVDSQLASDGDLSMGWPFAFYRVFHGDLGEGTFLSFTDLADDIMFVMAVTALLSLGGWLLKRRLSNPVSSNNENTRRSPNVPVLIVSVLAALIAGYFAFRPDKYKVYAVVSFMKASALPASVHMHDYKIGTVLEARTLDSNTQLLTLGIERGERIPVNSEVTFRRVYMGNGQIDITEKKKAGSAGWLQAKDTLYGRFEAGDFYEIDLNENKEH